jgi:hypothetical protein
MMNDQEFSELLRKLEKFGLNDGDIGYSYWHGVQQDLRQIWAFYKSNSMKDSTQEEESDSNGT